MQDLQSVFINAEAAMLNATIAVDVEEALDKRRNWPAFFVLVFPIN